MMRALVLLLGLPLALAFSPFSSGRKQRAFRPLRMSDIPKDEKEDLIEQQRFWKPPPPPEDQLVLTGDLLSLFVYGFTDHFLCQDISNLLVRQAGPEELAQVAFSTPVWLEPNDLMATQVLQQTQLGDQIVTHYSPVLEPTGLATCLLAGVWLWSGWLHRAFLFRNTLECRTDRALQVTARAWLTTCAIMLTIVGLSHVLYGSPAQSFTKGDVNYIFDSLTVLLIWRFIISSLMGGYGKD